MSTAVKVSYDEFEAMIEQGEFAVDDPRRYELIDGQIIKMPPPNPPHVQAIHQINKSSCRTLPTEEVIVSMQNPIGLPDLDSTPLPDVVWLRELDSSARRPESPHILLVIAVSDSSLWYDRNEKADLDAAAGLADDWIVNIPSRCVEVYREPGPSGYASRTLFSPGEQVHPLAFPEAEDRDEDDEPEAIS